MSLSRGRACAFLLPHRPSPVAPARADTAGALAIPVEQFRPLGASAASEACVGPPRAQPGTWEKLTQADTWPTVWNRPTGSIAIRNSLEIRWGVVVCHVNKEKREGASRSKPLARQAGSRQMGARRYRPGWIWQVRGGAPLRLMPLQ
jgi:hypothetical protein